MVTSSNHVAAATTNGQPQKKKLVLNAFVEMCMQFLTLTNDFTHTYHRLTMSRLRPPIPRPLEAPRRSILRLQLRQALDQPRSTARKGQISRHLHRRRPRWLRRLRPNSRPRREIRRSMAGQRASIARARHGRSNRKYRFRLHDLNILRTTLPPRP